ncbi:MAG: alpha/beta hydrolase [Microscillaceae bacterium]|nr:alpha/beta hydrolase [Microscillaceae bacterium]MDW8461130.1 alpha/beta hydrolase [Cytophagales bacterium]
METFFKTTDGYQMHYEYFKHPTATQTILFLGGLTQTTMAWHAYVPKFSQKYNILLLDLIFQGKSDEAEKHRSFEHHAQDVMNLAKFLECPVINLVGISYGSAVALRILKHYPQSINKAVLMSAFAHKPPFFEAISYSWKRALAVGGYDLLLDVMLPHVLGKSYFEKPIIPIEKLKELRKENPPSITRLQKLMQATEESGNYLRDIVSVKTPTLLLAGEEDFLCTPNMHRDIAVAMQKARVKVIGRKGHTLNLEAIPETTKEIEQWLSA